MTTVARRSATLFVCIALAATLAALVSAAAVPAAASSQERIGGRINVILGTPTQFPAGDPFHITHGWGPESGVTDADAIGRYRFELDVDGVRTGESFVERSVVPGTGGAPDLHSLFWTFNFPQGMAGTHTFTGHWYAPCAAAVGLGYAGPCTSPTTPVEALTRTLTVEFLRVNLALGKPVTASNEYPGSPASLAVDGSWWTYWNSGNFPPQWIELDLGAVETVGEIRLGITQLPDSPTVHRVLGRSSTSEPWTLLRTFDGYTVDQQVLSYVAPTPQQIRFIRVETTSSSSWVAWREIEVYRPVS
jgi:F5/8 type C domain-containing protein